MKTVLTFKWNLATDHPVYVCPTLLEMMIGMVESLELTYKELQELINLRSTNSVWKFEAEAG